MTAAYRPFTGPGPKAGEPATSSEPRSTSAGEIGVQCCVYSPPTTLTARHCWTNGCSGNAPPVYREKPFGNPLGIIGRLPNAAALTPVEVDRFLANPAWAKSTRATYHGAIRAWSLWLVRTGRRPDDPTLIATTPKVPKGRPRPVADEHLVVLLNSRMYRRTRAMILLGAYAGLRVSEIASIRGEHVDLITHTIAITGKGDKTRYIPLHPILQSLAEDMPVRSWWFPSWVGNHRFTAGGPVLGNSVSDSISKTMDRAGVPGKPHSLRHWFGSTLKEAGVDSLVIKELMGHESLATTAIYVQVPLRMQSTAVNLLPTLNQLGRRGTR